MTTTRPVKPTIDNWMARGECAADTMDLWFSGDMFLKVLAQHNCLFHCRVLRECEDYTDKEIEAGRYPLGIVQAGKLFRESEYGERPSKIKRWCTRCGEE